MINSIEIDNLGPIEQAKINELGRINLIIGENSTGKSYMLKALYAVHKTIEEFGKGDDIRKVNEIIAQKLRWTFQADFLGELVKRNANICNITIGEDHGKFSMKFGPRATVAISDVENEVDRIDYNSAFIPAREVFSIQKTILRSRDIDKVFGFDDSQYDLAKALQLIPSGREKIEDEPYKQLQDIMEGTIQLDAKSDKWQYVKDGVSFAIGTASDGIRKLGMLERLLENGYISNDSIVFIDEIEAGLHPSAIIQLLDIIARLVDRTNMQFFISSHSYFVIKKMNLMSIEKKEEKDYIKCIMPQNGVFVMHDLKDGMPDNPIIEESIRLYEEEVEGVL